MQVRLQGKCVQCPTNCVSCDSSNEDLAHMFFTCPLAMQVWTTTGLWNDIQQEVTDTSTSSEAIFLWLQCLTLDLTSRVLVLLVCFGAYGSIVNSK